MGARALGVAVLRAAAVEAERGQARQLSALGEIEARLEIDVVGQRVGLAWNRRIGVLAEIVRRAIDHQVVLRDIGGCVGVRAVRGGPVDRASGRGEDRTRFGRLVDTISLAIDHLEAVRAIGAATAGDARVLGVRLDLGLVHVVLPDALRQGIEGLLVDDRLGVRDLRGAEQQRGCRSSNCAGTCSRCHRVVSVWSWFASAFVDWQLKSRKPFNSMRTLFR